MARRWSCGPTRTRTSSEGLAQLERLRGELAHELATLDLRAAVAGLHPFTLWQDTKISEGDRYRFLYGSMRELARREPTFALHVHVAVPDAESAMLRRQPPALASAAAARPVGQLALLAGPRDGPGLGAHAAVPGVPTRGHSARLRWTTATT